MALPPATAPAAGAPITAAIPAALPAPSATTPTLRVPDYRRVVLPNGIVLLMMPLREVPLTAFTAVVRGGALGDSAGKAGLASLVAGLLEKGAGARDAFQFADAVADVGGSFEAGAGAESVTIGGQFLSRDRELMIELLADALQRPRLDAAEFAKLRERRVELIKASKDSDPSGLLDDYGRALLFGAHPYGSPVGGSERSLAAIAHDDVRDYWATRFGADRLTLVFAGDLDPAWLEAAVRRAFGRLGPAPAALPALPEPARIAGRRVLLVDSPGAAQTYFWIANVGVSRRYPDRAALDIVNTLYGGRFTSILNTELRVKSGLSYGARSSFVRGSVPGEFAITSFAQTENTVKALGLALETLANLERQPLEPAMLQSARSYVLGQFPLRLETASHWSAQLADLEFFGLGRDYIEGYAPALAAVTPADAARVIAAAFPSPQDLAIVLIGDAAQIRDELRRFGQARELTLASPDFVAPAAIAHARVSSDAPSSPASIRFRCRPASPWSSPGSRCRARAARSCSAGLRVPAAGWRRCSCATRCRRARGSAGRPRSASRRRSASAVATTA
ncbi:MAG: insulinase family protein [Gammaproteobacteria bacterium]|nr:insulinase family protein [Gammaproteobacteria bacterium]